MQEVAINVDLMLAGNGAERIDTLLHEMAHVADYLETGHLGHGGSWRAWARRVGCRPTHGTIQRPSDGGATNWNGGAFDPETGLLYVPSRNNFRVTRYYTPVPRDGLTVDYTHGGRGRAPEGPGDCRSSSPHTRG